MAAPYPRTRWSAASLVVLIGIVAVLHFAQDVIIPVALAVLLSFILAPVAKWLEHIGLNRVFAGVTTTVFAVAVICGLAYVVANQFIGLAQDLPHYKDNLRAKMKPLGRPLNGGLNETARTVKELADELQVPQKGETPPPRTPKVQVVPPPPNAMDQLRNVLGPVMRPMATLGIVIVFLLFMLLERDSLRDRLIRMTGANLTRTTRAMAEATHRVTRYLAMQTLVNGIEGALLVVGLWLIGVPNALLWGALMMVMRFIPYLGVWVAALFPTLLAIAVFDDWSHVVFTVGLIVALEIITSQFIEPLLYGHHTGVSPLALLVAAVFWTWLWGPAGLFLAIPLTVSLVVLGKYVPRLAFLGVLMGDEPVLEPWERYYQRLLARVPEEADEVVEELQKTQPPREVADQILIPSLAMVERDYYRGALDEAFRHYVLLHCEEVSDDLYPGTESARPGPYRVLCLPLPGEANRLAAMLLSHALQEQHIEAGAADSVASRTELDRLLDREKPQCVCVCAFSPAGIVAARRTSKALHDHAPGMRIFAVLWDLPEVPDRLARRFAECGAEKIITRIAGVLSELRGLPEPANAQGARSAAHA